MRHPESSPAAGRGGAGPPALASGGGAHAAGTRTRARRIPGRSPSGAAGRGRTGWPCRGWCARFNAENRDVQVTLTLYNWDLIFDRWRAEFDGGAPPDIVGIHATEVAEFAARGMLLNIAGRVQLQGIDAEEFPGALWRLCRRGRRHLRGADRHPPAGPVHQRTGGGAGGAGSAPPAARRRGAALLGRAAGGSAARRLGLRRAGRRRGVLPPVVQPALPVRGALHGPCGQPLRGG